jgi:hypothetical protein
MGNSFSGGVDALTQWTTENTYSGSTVDEDQIDEIEYELGALPDDHPALPLGTAVTVSGNAKKVKGLMNSGSDVDTFIVDLPTGGWIVTVEPNPCGPNIDCWLTLRNSPVGPPLADRRNSTSNVTRHSLSASATVPDAGGLFWISVGSDSSNGGYSKYGGVGSYTLTIKRPDGFESAAPVLSSAVVSGLKQGATAAEVELIFTDNSDITSFFTNSGTSVFLERTTGGVSIAGTRIGASSIFTDGSGAAAVARAKQKFRFPAPGGWWDLPEQGSYRVRVVANVAVDEWGNSSATTNRTVGTLAADTTPPVIKVAFKPILVAGDSDEAVEVVLNIQDDSPILVTDNGVGAFESISASGAPSITPVRSRYSKSNGGRGWTLFYFINPPGGTWDGDEAGQWTFQVKSGKVRDDRGNITAPVGTDIFSVQSAIFQQDFNVVSPDHGFTLAAGWENGFANGTSLPFDDPPPSDGNSSRYIGYAMTLSPTRDYGNNLDERGAFTPLIDTEGYENLSLRFRRWLTLRPGDNARIEVNDATMDDAWTTIWRSPQDRGVNDQEWSRQSIKLPAFVSNGALRVRWVMGSTDGSPTAGGWNVDDVEILAGGTYQPAKLVLAGPLFWLVQEGGSNLSYSVRLNQQPAQTVTVSLSAPADLSLNDTSLTFTSANWSVPQTIIVTAVNDSITEGTEFVNVRHKCVPRGDAGFNGVTLDRSIGITDNDPSVIRVQPVDVSLLPGTSGSFSVSPQTSVLLPTYQWYRGVKGDTRSPISGATDDSLRFELAARAAGPELYWVRVKGLGGKQEDSRQVSAAPLTGYEAFRARLLQRGYTLNQLNAPGFNNDDPDKNGMSHYAEFALGLMLGDAPRWALNIETVPAESGYPGEVDLLVTLPRLQPQVLYRLQSTPDGLSWDTEAELEGSDYSETGAVVRVPGGGNPTLMVRLKIEAVQ